MGNQQSLFDTLIHNNRNDCRSHRYRRTHSHSSSTSSFNSSFQSAFHFTSNSRQYNPQDCCALWKTIKSILGIWSTGNNEIDEIIKETQRTASRHRKPWKWIPFDKFENVKHVADGGYGSVFSAWCSDRDVYGKVALKSFENSEHMSKEYLEQLRALARFERSGGLIRVYGMTQHPQTNDYMLVMKFAKCNLREYIYKYYSTLSLSNKIEILVPISNGIKRIHQAGLIHGNFHPGNILITLINNPIDKNFTPTTSTPKVYSSGTQTWSYISDLGLSGPASDEPKKIINEDQFVEEPEPFDDNNVEKIIFEFEEKQQDYFASYINPSRSSSTYGRHKIYGVLPYLAPEVLRGQKYTQAADVYAFGFILYEVFVGHPPYHDVPHDYKLAQKICTGHRPSISSSDMPPRVMKLITSCWEPRPEDRPTAQEIHNTIRGWYWRLDPEMKSLMRADDETFRGVRSGTPIRDNSSSGYSTPQSPGTPVPSDNNYPTTPFTTPLNTSISQTYPSANNNCNLSPLSTTSTMSCSLNGYEVHPEAIYISRLLEFDNLPQTASWYF